MYEMNKIFFQLKSLNKNVPVPPMLHTIEEIAEKERKYNILFPPSYKEYLLKYSDIIVGTYEMFRMNEPEWPYIDLDTQVESARKIGLPEGYFPFLEVNADYFCFDLTTLGPEYQITYWSHDRLNKTERWSCFLDWVLNCWIKEELERQKG